jgi:lipopolysaccharide export system protein LptA
VIVTFPCRPTAPFARTLAFALAALAVAVCAPASAEKGDRDKPINYSADSGDVNYQTKVGALKGNVIITQGTMTIRADRIDFKQNADNSVSATAYGNPMSFRQKREGTEEWFEGYAQRAVYDGTREFLELFDQALLRRGQDEIRSNYISYNAATEQFKAEGRPGSKAPADDTAPGARVRGVFQPKSDALPGKSDKGSGKTEDKGAPKDADKAAAPALKPAGEIAPPAK